MTTKKPRILCVDDEPVNLQLLEAFLVPNGYEVVKAENGKKAVEKLEDGEIDLVLLDVKMPEMNGFEVCKRIKNTNRYMNTPVVMITALTSKADRIRGIEAGAEDFISKPFHHGEVLARINMLLRIKELNDRLRSAYKAIDDLTSYGMDIIKTFDPLSFDLMSNIDCMVQQIIKKSNDDSQKPSIVVVASMGNNGKREWTKYEYSGELTREPLKINTDACLLPVHHKHKLIISNQDELKTSNIEPVVSVIESEGISVTNMVSYHSEELCVTALNYGHEVTSFDAAVLNNLVMQSLFLWSLSSQVRETDEAFAYAVGALSRAAEENDEDTGNHIIRVGEYCAIISKQLGLPEKFINIIHLQGQMHDVGKLHIPSELLRKPGKLTAEEFEMMKHHSLYGARILGDHVRLTMAREIALSHHEKWDGDGYPYGLKGDQIPLPGRIVNIADIYDALRNKRVYKPAFDHATTYKIITAGDGRTMPHHFDPQVLKAFRETSTQFEEIYERMEG